MIHGVNRGKVLSQTEYFNEESVLNPSTIATHEAPVGKTVDKVQKILLYLDKPWMGESALPYIEDYISRLAPEVKVEILLLQVITQKTDYRLGDGVVMKVPYTKEEIKQTADEAVDYLNRVSEPLKNKGITVVARVGFGTDASKEIIKTAREAGADLIVMFTNRQSWLSCLTFGSVTDRLLRRENDIPILIVRTEKLMNRLN